MSSDFTSPGQSLPPLPPPGSPPTTTATPPKSPGLALILSFFPGLGQVYNGQPAKAFVFFAAWVVSIWGANEISPWPFAFLIPFVVVYNLIDAYRSACRINRRARGGLAEQEEDVAESPAWGGSLVAIGFVLLLHNLGWIDLHAFRRYWPVLLIVAGLFFLYGSIQKRNGGGIGGGGGL